MKKYKIQIELENIEGWKSALAKYLWTSAQAVDIVLKKINARFSTQEKYTKVFNKTFWKNFTREYLFKIIDIELWKQK